MDWLTTVFNPDSVPGAMVVIALAGALGLLLGMISFRGVKLGVAGVLFAGLAFGAAGARVNPITLSFLRDFGITVFVYALGLQVGPGFVASLRDGGLKYNALAATCLVGGAVFAAIIVSTFHAGRDAAPGVYVAGFTSTPGLVAAQQTFENAHPTPSTQPYNKSAQLSGLIYGMGYPFGCVAPILVMVLIRRIFKINVSEETRRFEIDRNVAPPPLSVHHFRLTNADLHGKPIREIDILKNTGAVIGKVLRGDQLQVATADTVLRLDDVLMLVGPADKVKQLESYFGVPSDKDLVGMPGAVQSDRLLVTCPRAMRKKLSELQFPRRFGVTITRVLRSGIELTPRANLTLNFGDTVVAVGPPQGLKQVAEEVGNATRALNYPQLVPVFIGIALGVLLGTIPIKLPGLNNAIKLGVAVGPLVVAIIFSRLGNVGRLIWYMPGSANFMFRESGLTLFLACVGLAAGKPFVATLSSGQGIAWLALAAAVSIIPMTLVAILARLIFNMNYVPLCGLIAGTMTNSPSIAYANDITRSEEASIIYATVYPLGMILPVVMAQLLAAWAG